MVVLSTFSGHFSGARLPGSLWQKVYAVRGAHVEANSKHVFKHGMLTPLAG